MNHPARTRPAHRQSGFTLIELMIVLVIAWIVMALAAPRLRATYINEQVRSTQAFVRSYLVATRAAALRSGRTAVFYSSSSTNSIRVTVDSSGTMVDLLPRVRLDSAYRVTFTSSADSIVYNGRGQAVGLSTPQTITLSAGSSQQRLCIGLAGAVQNGVCVQ
jgi:prepilin-type N-terminal cleavage/methylation domain-containing protein